MQDVVNTIRSNLAYILINRDGPGIQPGSRSYERSWMRDGAMIATALLQMGVTEEVRQYIEWYARYQRADGFIPCIVDSRGAEAVPEHDAHGQFLYMVMQYFRFTRDTTWLRGQWDRVWRTAQYIRGLRQQRKAEIYRTGDPGQRARFGLVPESISHEGYSAKPMHSYWDNFFCLRGLKDAAAIAATLGERRAEAELSAEVQDYRKAITNSISLAMRLSFSKFFVIVVYRLRGDFAFMLRSTTSRNCAGARVGLRVLALTKLWIVYPSASGSFSPSLNTS